MQQQIQQPLVLGRIAWRVCLARMARTKAARDAASHMMRGLRLACEPVTKPAQHQGDELHPCMARARRMTST